MSEITGTVQGIEKKHDKAGKPYYVVKVNDTNMGTYSFETIKDIKIGQEATVFYDQSGRYKDVTGSVPVIQQESVPFDEPSPTAHSSTPLGMPIPTPTSKKTYVTESDRQVLIIRQSSLRTAAEWLKGLPGADDTEKLIEVAMRFEAFVNTGE